MEAFRERGLGGFEVEWCRRSGVCERGSSWCWRSSGASEGKRSSQQGAEGRLSNLSEFWMSNLFAKGRVLDLEQWGQHQARRAWGGGRCRGQGMSGPAWGAGVGLSGLRAGIARGPHGEQQEG